MDHPVLQLFINANKSRDLHFSRLRSRKNQLAYGYVGATPTAHTLWRLPALRVVYTPTVRELKNYSKFIYYKISMQREVTSVVLKYCARPTNDNYEFKPSTGYSTSNRKKSKDMDIIQVLSHDANIHQKIASCGRTFLFSQQYHIGS